MAQVLTRVRCCQRARGTAWRLRLSTRAQRVSSAEERTWAWRPQRRLVTRRRLPAGARWWRWCWWRRKAMALVQERGGGMGYLISYSLFWGFWGLYLATQRASEQRHGLYHADGHVG